MEWVSYQVVHFSYEPPGSRLSCDWEVDRECSIDPSTLTLSVIFLEILIS